MASVTEATVTSAGLNSGRASAEFERGLGKLSFDAVQTRFVAL